MQENFRQQIEALGKLGKKDAEFLSVLYTRGVVDFVRAANMSVEEAAKRPEWNIRFMYDREGRMVGLSVGGNTYDQNMFHGTRHNLGGRFDLTKIGTGEGGQVFGHGIYGAEARKIAEKYRTAGLSYEEALKNPGNLYTVEGPENDILLDYDATMEHQPDLVKKVMAEAEQEFGVTFSKYFTGMNFYDFLSRKLGSEKEASMWLKDHGIPGLRYWDELSRNTREGTHNFVIWNTDLLKIMGVEGPAAETERYNQTMPNIPDDQIKAVRKRYEGTEQFMKAPNGKPTNLTEKQWLQVRTPAFKEWFGDWELAEAAER